MLPISITADFLLRAEGYFNVSQHLCLLYRKLKGMPQKF